MKIRPVSCFQYALRCSLTVTALGAVFVGVACGPTPPSGGLLPPVDEAALGGTTVNRENTPTPVDLLLQRQEKEMQRQEREFQDIERQRLHDQKLREYESAHGADALQ